VPVKRDVPCAFNRPNEPLDKAALQIILKALSESDFISAEYKVTDIQQQLIPKSEDLMSKEKNIEMDLSSIPELPPEDECIPDTCLVFDLETKFSAEEVGGWRNAHKMMMALGVIYDVDLDRYETYLEKDVERLIRRLKYAGLVVGFNTDGFDFKVLSGYVDGKFPKVNSLDMLVVLKKQLGHRLSLNQLAEATLDVNKSADGLQSLVWWNEGKIDLIAEYCKKDVEITYRVYSYGQENGHLLYFHRSGVKVKVPVTW